ncbi:MAG: pyruvate:ferredoxin (flavodoxin) oxidoreductase [Clostridiaceae bacterium]|nr:pyruvate:ferredoxin (flavodoxin) oxidoreductase [Clostridiaceae bacterium]
MARKMKTMDGNTAAAHASYAFTDVAAIYPITPSSPMADLTDQWAANGLKNVFGQEVKVVEMQSEGGAAGAVHGSLAAGALTTTYTASQGLLLMIPNMYKIAGELLPCVIHCSARALASHALSIFGDHQDVMACRQTGFAMLASTNPQEAMDLGAVAHLAAIKGRVPFLHFFDGFRTSHEIQKIETWDYEDLKEMVDMDAVQRFRDNALNPEHPVQRGTAQNPDIFFQAKEASNPYYEKLPAIVEEYMGKVNAKIGTDYALFNYYGANDATDVIIAMGSVNDTIEEVIDYKLAQGEKVGLLKVRLYRPFVASKFVAALPKTVKRIAVLDRTKEPGSQGEPLYLDVVTALATQGVSVDLIAGGRYGLGSKDTPPSSIFAVYDNLTSANPKKDFTVGINDDVTNLSLEIKDCPDTAPAGTVACKFWGLGGDGTVGANKNSIKIIGDHTNKYAQAYFAYDSKKTGGITVSHLRFGDKPIKSPYYITKADFVACHNPSYVGKYDMVQDVKKGGTFLLNCQWNMEEIEHHLPNKMKSYIAKNNIAFYTVNAIDKAREIGMGKRTNTILQSAFFKLANIIAIDEAVGYMKEAAKKSYGKKGDDIVNMNYKAIDAGVDALVKIDVPASWADLKDDTKAPEVTGNRPELVKFVKEILIPVSAQKGDDLPVSAFVGREDGTFPSGGAAYEKRGVAVDIPQWIPENCIQCNQCSIVCPHATIRPYAMDAGEVKNAPAALKSVKMIGKGCEEYQFAITISPLDCMGCGLCANVCPAPKGKALVMVPQESQLDQQAVYDYAVENVTRKQLPFAENTVKGSQFNVPLLEYSGACAGCVETAYARLVTQLFGDRMYVANATGCSSIWGGSAPAMPYTVNKEGKGPAWANSLFEDNAEYGLGMAVAVKQMRNRLKDQLTELAEKADSSELKAACQNWIDNMMDANKCKEAVKVLLPLIENGMKNGCDLCKAIYGNKDFLNKKTVWIFGGDGWAYDIGYGGLDHVLASGEDINVFVFDTEVYSNTGGQASKSSQIGQVAQFAAAGKSVAKKDLAAIAMQYGYVYVAQVGMGSNQQQTVKAIVEAESYNGPSIVIGYAPCEMHGVKGGMTNSQAEIKKAVEDGYWHLFRFDPRVAAEGKNGFVLDSKAPTGNYQDFLKNEVRYTSLTRSFPERADWLFEKAAETAKAKYERLAKLAAQQ